MARTVVDQCRQAGYQLELAVTNVYIHQLQGLGMEYHIVQEGETGEFVIESPMRHVRTEPTGDRFEIEEIYQAARSAIREKAA
jgi:hypothetical protein